LIFLDPYTPTSHSIAPQLIAASLKDALYVRSHTQTFHTVCQAVLACHAATTLAADASRVFTVASDDMRVDSGSGEVIDVEDNRGGELPPLLKQIFSGKTAKSGKSSKPGDIGSIVDVTSSNTSLIDSSSLHTTLSTLSSSTSTTTALMPLSSTLTVPPTTATLAAFNTAATSAAKGETLDATLLATLGEQFRYICGSTDDRDMGEGEVCVEDDGLIMSRYLTQSRKSSKKQDEYSRSGKNIPKDLPLLHICRCFRCVHASLSAAARHEHRLKQQEKPKSALDEKSSHLTTHEVNVPASLVLSVMNSPAILFSTPATHYTAHITDILSLAAGEETEQPSATSIASLSPLASAFASPTAITNATDGTSTLKNHSLTESRTTSAPTSTSVLALTFVPTSHKIEITRSYLTALARLSSSLSAGSAHQSFSRVLPMLYDYIAHYDPIVRQATMAIAYQLLAGHAPRTHALITDAFQRLVGAYLRTQEADFLTSLAAHVYGITGYFGRDLVMDLNAVNAVGRGLSFSGDNAVGEGTERAVKLNRAVRQVLGLQKSRKARKSANIAGQASVSDDIAFSDDEDQDEGEDDLPLEGLTEEEIDALLKDSEMTDPLIEILKEFKKKPVKRDQR